MQQRYRVMFEFVHQFHFALVCIQVAKCLHHVALRPRLPFLLHVFRVQTNRAGLPTLYQVQPRFNESSLVCAMMYYVG